jgi:hypothetical protein
MRPTAQRPSCAFAGATVPTACAHCAPVLPRRVGPIHGMELRARCSGVHPGWDRDPMQTRDLDRYQDHPRPERANGIPAVGPPARRPEATRRQWRRPLGSPRRERPPQIGEAFPESSAAWAGRCGQRIPPTVPNWGLLSKHAPGLEHRQTGHEQTEMRLSRSTARTGTQNAGPPRGGKANAREGFAWGQYTGRCSCSAQWSGFG